MGKDHLSRKHQFLSFWVRGQVNWFANVIYASCWENMWGSCEDPESYDDPAGGDGSTLGNGYGATKMSSSPRKEEWRSSINVLMLWTFLYSFPSDDNFHIRFIYDIVISAKFSLHISWSLLSHYRGKPNAINIHRHHPAYQPWPEMFLHHPSPGALGACHIS